jgi:hypothetical protein
MLEGWNHIPKGYAATFDVDAAPRWLRIWFRTPIVDRWAYPQMVTRGFGYLTPHPGIPVEPPADMPNGWRLRPADFQPPGSVTDLR